MSSAFGNPTATKNVSYLCVHDPSIIGCGPLQGSENLTENISKEVPEYKTHLRVYLRMKKTDNYTKELYEISDENTLLCKLPPVTCCDKNMSSAVTKVFTFSRIFVPDAKQIDIFNDVVKEKLLHFMNGYNCNLLTYGASGSGKTYTVVGTVKEPGILPRSLEYLFRTLPGLQEEPGYKPDPLGGVRKLPIKVKKYERLVTRKLLEKNVFNSDPSAHIRAYRKMQQRLSNKPVAKVANDITEDVSLGVWVSFAEIYNENVRDLLVSELPRRKPRQTLHLGQCEDKGYIKDLIYINVRSGEEAYQILQYGIHNLQYAATSINDHSSRSHSIFTILLVQASDIQKGNSVSSFNFCDLAGAERAKKLIMLVIG